MTPSAPPGVTSIRGVCEVELFAGTAVPPERRPDLLIEIPHGATRAADFAATRAKLSGPFPDRLEEFFFVNTDVGAPECARVIARMLAEPDDLDNTGMSVLIVRCLVPRTFIDCNRALEAPGGARDKRLTPPIPDYVRSEEDRRFLVDLYEKYQAVVDRAYAAVCGGGGTALMLHTYAPKSVGIDTLDDGIVKALHRAYEPATYATWETRPDVDVISETADGERPVPPGSVEAIRETYRRIGIEVTENVAYHLHPATTAHRHAMLYPGQTLCIEISRALLADPFTPFVEMRIGEEKAIRMAGPLAEALRSRPEAPSG